MRDRPVIDKELDSNNFRSYYYLKEELIKFCKKSGMQTSGGKIELTDRIAHYLDTDEKSYSKLISKVTVDIGDITKETLIESNFVCSEKHRDYFKQAIGNSFSFNVIFQKWLKANTGKTYQQAIEAYYQILVDKKKGKTIIDKQFEYNIYIRDFFADNVNKTLSEAIKCWKYKKEFQGHICYEKADLVALV